MQITIHRVFDLTKNIFLTLEDIIELGGCDRILTSGGEVNATLGKQ